LIYFKTYPNHLGRFGHQLSNLLVGLAFANIFDGICLNPFFVGQCSLWNDYMDLPFLLNKRIAHNIDLNQFDSMNLSLNNNTVDFSSLVECHLLNCLSTDLLVHLPEDAFFDPSIYRAFSPILKMLPHCINRTPGSAQTLNQISLHVRRGDVSPTYASSLYTPDNIYVNCLSLIHGNYPPDWPIVIYSQGNPSQFQSLISELNQLIGRRIVLKLDEDIMSFDARSTLDELILSKVLIGSHSSFFHYALYLSSNMPFRFFISHRKASVDKHIQLLMRELGVIVLLPQ
jgi:hypothetical protein